MGAKPLISGCFLYWILMFLGGLSNDRGCRKRLIGNSPRIFLRITAIVLIYNNFRIMILTESLR